MLLYNRCCLMARACRWDLMPRLDNFNFTQWHHLCWLVCMGYGWIVPCYTSPSMVRWVNFLITKSYCSWIYLVSIYSIGQVCKEKGLKKRSVFENVFLPLIFTGIFIYTWLSSSSSIIFSENHFIAFAIFTGLLFGEMASDIILAHLTKSEYPRFLNIYIPLFLTSLLVNLQSFFYT